MEVIAVVVGSFVLAGGFIVGRTAKRVIQHKRMARSSERDRQDAYYNNNYLKNRNYQGSQQYVHGDQKDFESVPVPADPRYATQPQSQIQYEVASGQQIYRAQKDFEPVPVPGHPNQPQIQYDVASSQQSPPMYADQKIPSMYADQKIPS